LKNALHKILNFYKLVLQLRVGRFSNVFEQVMQTVARFGDDFRVSVEQLVNVGNFVQSRNGPDERRRLRQQIRKQGNHLK